MPIFYTLNAFHGTIPFSTYFCNSAIDWLYMPIKKYNPVVQCNLCFSTYLKITLISKQGRVRSVQIRIFHQKTYWMTEISTDQKLILISFECLLDQIFLHFNFSLIKMRRKNSTIFKYRLWNMKTCVIKYC